MWSIACMAKFQVMNSTIGFSPAKCRADADPGKAIFGDRRIDHAARSELIEQALGDFVGALILADLLAHEEHRRIAPHLLGHGVAQRLAHGHGDHCGAGRAPRLRAAAPAGAMVGPAGAFSTAGRFAEIGRRALSPWRW